MGDVIRFPGNTRLDLDPDVLLKEASEHGLREVVICGFDQEGNEYHASSVSDAGEVLWILRRCEHALMQLADGEPE